MVELRRQTFLMLPLTSVLLGVVLKHVFVVNSTIQDGQILNLGLLIGREAVLKHVFVVNSTIQDGQILNLGLLIGREATSASLWNLPETSDDLVLCHKRNETKVGPR